jgi:hypothetical protein
MTNGERYCKGPGPQATASLPIAFVGTTAQAQGFEAKAQAKAPGSLSVRPVPDPAAAKQAIRDRDVYGALVL